MNEAYRQEHKFLLTISQAVQIKSYLSCFLKEDTHNNTEGYLVRTLYFDSINNDDYMDKINGLNHRKKMRLRIYNIEDDFARLEMKQKSGTNQLKRSLTVPKSHALELCKGNYNSLLEYKEDFAAECFGVLSMNCYRPATIISYNRYAYQAYDCNTRITLDSNIKSIEGSYDLFSSNLGLYPVIDPSFYVMEVKYNKILLSYIKDLIQMVNSSRQSSSKYCMGRYLTQNP